MANPVYSMTGFGDGAATTDAFSVRVEIRAVNNRGSKISFRSRPPLNAYEKNLRDLISERLQRGSIDVNVTLNRHLDPEIGGQIEETARGAVATIRAIAKKLGLAGEVTVSDLLAIPGLFSESLNEPVTAEEWPAIERAAREALDKLCAMRAAEGRATADRLLEILKPVEDFQKLARERAPLVVERQREKLMARLAELGEVRDVDQQSLEREMVFYADHVDINEEMDRLASHAAQFRATLAQGGEIGKRLEFLAQEFLREVNTTASKANDLTITAAAVDAKTAVEKLKEQTANIE